MGFKIKYFWVVLPILGGILLMFGCTGSTLSIDNYPDYQGHSKKGYDKIGVNDGPPPWATAHGYRAKHRYCYYPSAEIYFDLGRRLFFYNYHNNWRCSVSLPRYIRLI